MIKKDVKLSPKKDGHGNISSFTVNIGATEAKNCGFVKDNVIQSIEKIIDTDNNQIIIQLKAEN